MASWTRSLSTASGNIAKGLLDELHLLVNPTAIGAGLPVFPNLELDTRARFTVRGVVRCAGDTRHLADDTLQEPQLALLRDGAQPGDGR